MAGSGKGDKLNHDEEIFQPPNVPIDYNPNENSIDISPPGKEGKLYKEIIRAGVGDETPCDGVEVEVHYIGTLTDGTEFDRSNRQGKPFTFTLGKKSVIGGWEAALATMKKGEVAKIFVHPELGYGEQGSGPKIGPNATLVFEIELLNWQLEDISKAGDGGIRRRVIITADRKFYTPNDGAEVVVSLEGFYEGKSFDKRDKVQFSLGEGSEVEIIPGIEEALLKMPEGETSELIFMPKHAFGSAGNTSLLIPPNAEVRYIVTLHKFVKAKEVWSLDGPEKMECARGFKAKGTNFFQQKKYALAAKFYKKIEEFLKTEALLNGEVEEERKALLAAGYLNASQCYLELGEFLNAKNSAENALELQNGNVKGWFRKGVANLGLNEPRAAKSDFLKVLSFDADNNAAKIKLQIAERLVKEENTKQKNLYTKMLGGMK